MSPPARRDAINIRGTGEAKRFSRSPFPVIRAEKSFSGVFVERDFCGPDNVGEDMNLLRGAAFQQRVDLADRSALPALRAVEQFVGPDAQRFRKV